MNTCCDIRFIYQNSDYYIAREIICSKLYEAAVDVLDLPASVEIQFATLPVSVCGYTSLGHRFKNRLVINCILGIGELPMVLVHEIIHLNQTHTGILSTTPSGAHYWNGKFHSVPKKEMDYKEYMMLPWEQDVIVRHRPLMNDILSQALKRANKE